MDHTLIGQFWVRRCDVAVLFAARAHRKFSWLVLSVYGVVCSEVDEGVQDLIGGGAARGGRHPPGMAQRPYFALASWVMGVKRLTSPPSGSRRIIERLPHGMSVGSSTISGTVWGTRPLTRSQVASTSSTRSSMKTERFWPGTGAAAPSIPTVAGAPMAMVPVGVLSSAKTGTGRVAGRPVTCSQKVARRSTSWVITRTETKSMTVPFAGALMLRVVVIPATLDGILDSIRPLSSENFAGMAKPLARVLALLDILQTGGTRTLRELSGRLGVDERTVRRYADHLLDLDVPVESVRGRYGGYRLAPGYRMPPLMLTDDEALAVLVGLVGARRATLQPDTAVAVESATAKVRRVLPRTLAARLDALVAATSYADEGRTPTTPETGVLLTVAEAAVRRRPLAITYRDKNDRYTERVLEPYGVVALRGRWYATGLDSRSGQVRSFRLDRVARAVVQEGRFSVPGGFDPAAQVTEAVSGASYRHAVSVRVQGSEKVVRMRMPGSIATIEPVTGEPGWVRARWRVQRLDWVPSVLAGLDRPFVIEEPGELRERVRALAGQLATYADAR